MLNGAAPIGHDSFIRHPQFAKSAQNSVRGFLLLLKDMRALFDFVEPGDANKDCYSFRIHELLFRACVEVEANCKAILDENGYRPGSDRDYWNMSDYKKVQDSHRLSEFQVKLPNWDGNGAIRIPFGSWGQTTVANRPALKWYEAYNCTKHNRHTNFQEAKLKHMIDAVCGVLVLLSSQFYTDEFTTAPMHLVMDFPNDGFELAIGEMLAVKFPNWPPAERYDFNWDQLKASPQPFTQYTYP
jgi:hypothetical protein